MKYFIRFLMAVGVITGTVLLAVLGLIAVFTVTVVLIGACEYYPWFRYCLVAVLVLAAGITWYTDYPED